RRDGKNRIFDLEGSCSIHLSYGRNPAQTLTTSRTTGKCRWDVPCSECARLGATESVTRRRLCGTGSEKWAFAPESGIVTLKLAQGSHKAKESGGNKPSKICGGRFDGMNIALYILIE